MVYFVSGLEFSKGKNNYNKTDSLNLWEGSQGIARQFVILSYNSGSWGEAVRLRLLHEPVGTRPNSLSQIDRHAICVIFAVSDYCAFFCPTLTFSFGGFIRQNNCVICLYQLCHMFLLVVSFSRSVWTFFHKFIIFTIEMCHYCGLIVPFSKSDRVIFFGQLCRFKSPIEPFWFANCAFTHEKNAIFSDRP